MKKEILLSLFAIIISSLQLNATNVKLEGTWKYSMDYENCKVRISGEKIVNNESGGYSGTLKIQLRFTSEEYSGGSIGGNIVAEYVLNPLQGGYQYSGIDQILDFIPPETSTYYVTIALLEYIDDNYYIISHLNFNGQITYNKGVHLLTIIASGLNTIDNSLNESNYNYNNNYNSGNYTPNNIDNTPKLKRKTCSFCNGSRVSPIATSVAAFGNTDEHFCSDCGKMVSATHGAHLRCTSCGGKGYTEGY